MNWLSTDLIINGLNISLKCCVQQCCIEGKILSAWTKDTRYNTKHEYLISFMKSAKIRVLTLHVRFNNPIYWNDGIVVWPWAGCGWWCRASQMVTGTLEGEITYMDAVWLLGPILAMILCQLHLWMYRSDWGWGACFNQNIIFYGYKYSYYKVKTARRPSYLYYENFMYK